MNQISLKSLLEAEIDGAIGYLQTETTEQRTRSLEYYLRYPYGNEVEGRSQIVTGEVAEVIDGAIPQLIRIFTASDDIIRYEPVGPGDEQGANQATDYSNWVFYKDNPGFAILHDWFKDALLEKVGVVKAYWDNRIDVVKETYQNLTDDELTMLLADGTREIIEQETIVTPVMNIDGTPAIGLDGMPLMQASHTVKVKKKNQIGRVAIQNIPPEEFLISKKATTIQDSPFVAHRRLIPRSDLVAMGFPEDVVRDLPAYDDLSFSPERVARYSEGEQPSQDESLDPSMQDVEVYECYIRADMDGDGLAELLQVWYAGNKILEETETDYIPFHSLCPIPVPHKFYGLSLADKVMDLQLQKSTITRQMLDNLYLTNNYRVGAVDGQVNLDDLISPTPGGVIRMKNPNAVVPMAVQPVANQAFPMLEYLDAVQAKRTGVSDATQGLDPNVLQNVTATAVAAFQNASAGKMELIARNFAETGVKSLFKGILQLLCKYQDKPRIIRMRGQYVQMDPREWSNQYDVSISVGLGTGNKQEQMAMLAMILDKQERILQQFGPANPLVTVGQYRETLGRMIEAAGFKDSSTFFKPVTPEIDQALSNPPPQQQQPDPAIQAMMMQAQAQLEIDRQKALADIQAKREKAAAEIQLAREKAAAELELKRQEFEAEVQLKAAKIGAGISSNIEIPG
jgi:hypothetical protein